MRRPLAAVAVAVALSMAFAAAAQLPSKSIRIGEPERVAPFHVGGTDIPERAIGAIRNGAGFAAITLRAAPLKGAPAEIRYTPIDQNGRAVFTEARPILSSAGLGEARVSDTGSNAALLWTDDGTISVASLTAGGIVGTRHVIGRGSSLDFGCNPSRCLSAWNDLATQEVTAAITDAAGNVIIDHLRLPAEYRGMATDPTGFLLVAFNRVTHIDQTTGAVTFDIFFPGGEGEVAADFDGNDYVVVWVNFFDPDQRELAAKLSLVGTLSAPKIITTRRFRRRALVWTGSEHLVAHSDEPEPPPLFIVGVAPPPRMNVFVTRLGSALDVLDAELRVTNNGLSNVVTDAAWNGTSLYVSYEEVDFDITDGPHARGAFVSARPEVLSDQRIAVGPLSQSKPVLASNSRVLLAAWVENDIGSRTTLLRGALLLRDGTGINDDIAIATAKSIRVSRVHGVAACGDDFLIVWNEADSRDAIGRPMAAIVRASGAVERIALPFGPSFGVTSNGSSWLVTTLSTDRKAFAVRIARSGVILNPEPMAFGEADDVDVASDGDRFAVLRSKSIPFPCRVNCDEALLTLLDSGGGVVASDLHVDDGSEGIEGSGDGYLILGGFFRARRIDRDGHPSVSSVALRAASSFGGMTSFGSGWLILLGADRTTNTLSLVNRGATSVIESVDAGTLQAMAANGDGTVSALFARADEIPHQGFAAALVLRELRPVVPSRAHGTR